MNTHAQPYAHAHAQPLPRNIRNRNSKFDKNITKRGNVPAGKAADKEEDPPANRLLIAFFFVVVVGSSLVQVFNLFGKGPALGDDGADAGAGAEP
ncbi:MAG: hypothetical protein SGBAC_004701 [Bacillariaceae sp.]